MERQLQMILFKYPDPTSITSVETWVADRLNSNVTGYGIRNSGYGIRLTGSFLNDRIQRDVPCSLLLATCSLLGQKKSPRHPIGAIGISVFLTLVIFVLLVQGDWVLMFAVYFCFLVGGGFEGAPANLFLYPNHIVPNNDTITKSSLL